MKNVTGYMKHYIFPRHRKIWRHDKSSQLYTQLLRFPRILSTYCLNGRSGGENNWLEVRMCGPHAARFVRLTRNQIFSFFFSFPLLWCNNAARGSTASFRVHFSRANDFTQFILVSLWSVSQPQVVYKLKNANTLTKFWNKSSNFGKYHLNLL